MLLADELRELIMREALANPDYVAGDDISWPPLDYPTPMDDLETKPIQRICDLKKEQSVYFYFQTFLISHLLVNIFPLSGCVI